MQKINFHDVNIDEWLLSVKNQFVHYSEEYGCFLESILPSTKISYLVSGTSEKVTGILPFATSYNKYYGTIINSLPFFGSHGGPLTDGSHSSTIDLLCQLEKHAIHNNVNLVTLVENPFSPLSEDAVSCSRLTETDVRIGQFTTLPFEDTSSIPTALFSLFHVKTRNAIRKGQKLNTSISQSNDPCHWEWLQLVHQQSISALGGIPKPMHVFNNLQKSLPGKVRLYISTLDDKPIAGLVVICYNETVEYFTPAVLPAYRDSQILSALIYHVMRETTLQGFRLWNWGGTWRSQCGVYRFKSRWGARDLPYRYFNHIYNKNFLEHDLENLKPAYPFSYLFRYS